LDKIREKKYGKTYNSAKKITPSKPINEQRFLEKPDKAIEEEAERAKTVTKGILDLFDEKINS